VSDPRLAVPVQGACTASVNRCHRHLRYPRGSRIPVKSVSVLQLQDGASTLFKVLVPDRGRLPESIGSARLPELRPDTFFRVECLPGSENLFGPERVGCLVPY